MLCCPQSSPWVEPKVLKHLEGRFGPGPNSVLKITAIVFLEYCAEQVIVCVFVLNVLSAIVSTP